MMRRLLAPVVNDFSGWDAMCAARRRFWAVGRETLDAGTAKLRLAFHMLANDAGGFTATLDSLDQNARGIAVQETTYADRSAGPKLRNRRFLMRPWTWPLRAIADWLGH